MRLHGLYAITDSTLTPDTRLPTAVAAAIHGGARVVQYRDKRPDPGLRQRLAAVLNSLCRAHDVIFLINDDVELAATVGAHGVHLGRDDTDCHQARRRLGAAAIIGISCYNDLDRARTAAARGADYVAFGRFFASSSKPQAVAADLALLAQARRELTLPIVAIGGITPDNGAPLLAAGADMLAVIHGLFGQPDVEAAARRYVNLFS